MIILSNKIIYSFIVARSIINSEAFGIYRLNGFETSDPKIVAFEKTVPKAKERLHELAQEVANNIHGHLVEADVPQKHQRQFQDWAKTVQVITSKAVIVILN